MNNPFSSFAIVILYTLIILILSLPVFCNGWGCPPLMVLLSIPVAITWFAGFIVLDLKKHLKILNTVK